jgi:hypothetical protein
MSTAASLWPLVSPRKYCKRLLFGVIGSAIFFVLIAALLILFACLLIRIARLNCRCCLMLAVGSDS